MEEQKKGGLLDANIGFDKSAVWRKLYNFQQDGVKGAINKILKYNGCILADSVGLGKTFEALAVIKYFELKNYSVLVICPKKLKENWSIYTQADDRNILAEDRFNYKILCHTDLGRTSGKSGDINLATISWSNFDLIVIDESHNFRGNPMAKIKEDGSTKMNRSKWLMEKIIKSGAKTKVLLLSATPVNNTLRDLRNQIHLITEGENTLKLDDMLIPDLSQTLKNAQTQFTIWAKGAKKERTVSSLLEKLDTSFFKLLDGMTIARSRNHIKKFYNLSEIGKFPNREKPISVYPVIDVKNMFPSYDRLNTQILEFKLTIYNPSEYVFEHKKNDYNIKTKEQLEEIKKERAAAKANKKSKNKATKAEEKDSNTDFDQGTREHFLIGMMKVNYLKRLESSIKSFKISMERTIDKINKLEDKINKFKKTKIGTIENDDIEPTDDTENDDENDNEPSFSDFEVGKKLKFKLEDIDIERWLTDLDNDRETLISLFNNAHAVTPERDAKLKKLLELIKDKVQNPKNEDNKKVIIFTAYSDTATHLYDNINAWATKTLGLHTAMVAGSETKTTYGKSDFSDILTNFSPLAKNRASIPSMKQDEEIDILIATDCISEGQNLQDCDYLINYDIHWNPVRVIQRFGRIDRLGSKNNTIHLVNFWPTQDLDKYINLKDRVESRMALVDITATGEDNILNTEELEDLITDDLKYRNEQLKRLQNEVLDIEDVSDGISLTDFSLDDFRIDLSNYFNENREKLSNSPLGLYAVVPAPLGEHKGFWKGKTFSERENEVITPGVVYCLRLKNNFEGSEKINPLQPFFLVYIKDNAKVFYNYVQPKQILEVFRLMCQGQKQAFEKLCEIFNLETDDGKDMKTYSTLLKQAIEAINTTFRKKVSHSLTFDFDAVVPIQAENQQMDEPNNFELITWLIIK